MLLANKLHNLQALRGKTVDARHTPLIYLFEKRAAPSFHSNGQSGLCTGHQQAASTEI